MSRTLKVAISCFAVLPGVFVLLTVSQGYAAIITNNASYSPVLQVDASSGFVLLPLSDPGLITDVDIFIDFTKSDDPIAFDGTPSGTGFSFNNEIVFTLFSPNGTPVSLVAEGTYSGQEPGARIVLTLDDSAANPVGGPVLVGGAFKPVGLLSDFNGQSPTGNWTLFYADTVGLDPMSLNSWTLTVTTNSEAIPEPSSIFTITGLALCSGLAGWWRKRRKVPS